LPSLSVAVVASGAKLRNPFPDWALGRPVSQMPMPLPEWVPLELVEGQGSGPFSVGNRKSRKAVSLPDREANMEDRMAAFRGTVDNHQVVIGSAEEKLDPDNDYRPNRQYWYLPDRLMGRRAN
jgi:hypothetical protein